MQFLHTPAHTHLLVCIVFTSFLVQARSVMVFNSIMLSIYNTRNSLYLAAPRGRESAAHSVMREAVCASKNVCEWHEEKTK
jgi:hypothetical protein